LKGRYKKRNKIKDYNNLDKSFSYTARVITDARGGALLCPQAIQIAKEEKMVFRLDEEIVTGITFIDECNSNWI
jgi:hypothetical protein